MKRRWYCRTEGDKRELRLFTDMFDERHTTAYELESQHLKDPRYIRFVKAHMQNRLARHIESYAEQKLMRWMQK